MRHNWSIYGNGFLIADMGEFTPILDGPGNDFNVSAQGGTYRVSISNNLQNIFQILGTAQGNASFDLASVNITSAQYIKIEYYGGSPISLYGIIANYYNTSTPNPPPPQISPSGLASFIVQPNQTTINITWNASDQFAWNYSIYINDSLFYTGPWVGDMINVSYTWPQSGTYDITLLVYDIIGNSTENTVIAQVIPGQANSNISLLNIIEIIVGIAGLLCVGIFLYQYNRIKRNYDQEKVLNQSSEKEKIGNE